MKLGGAVAVPDNASVGAVPVALLETERVAAKLPADAEANVMEIAQFAPATSEVPQVFVWVKAEAPVPPMEIPVIFKTPLPVLAS